MDGQTEMDDNEWRNTYMIPMSSKLDRGQDGETYICINRQSEQRNETEGWMDGLIEEQNYGLYSDIQIFKKMK